MKKLIFFFLLLATFSAQGKTKPYIIQAEKRIVVVGKTSTGTDINANAIIFRNWVYNYHFDSIRNELVIVVQKQTSHKGGMGALDLATNEFKWAREFQGNRFDFTYGQDKVVLRHLSEIAVYDRDGAATKWKKQGGFTWVDLQNNIGLSYDGTGTNLDDGKVRWKTKINNKYGWQDVVYLDDENILIAAEGLKKINLKDGSGWQYDARLGADDYASMAGKAAAGIALGVITGVAVVPTGPDQIFKLCSNILIDSNRIYFASRDDIASLDAKGKVIWKKVLPEKQTGSSTIWIEADRIYMLNNAFGYRANGKVNKGDPYIAAFDKKSGKQIYLTELGSKKMLRTTGFAEDTIYTHSGDKLHKYELTTGRKLLEIDLDSRLPSTSEFISEESAYIRTAEGQFKNLAKLYPGEKFLSGHERIGRINQQLRLAGTIEYNNLWHLHSQNGATAIFTQPGKMAFVKNGTEQAVINIHQAELHGRTLIDVNGHELRIIDVASMLN